MQVTAASRWHQALMAQHRAGCWLQGKLAVPSVSISKGATAVTAPWQRTCR